MHSLDIYTILLKPYLDEYRDEIIMYREHYEKRFTDFKFNIYSDYSNDELYEIFNEFNTIITPCRVKGPAYSPHWETKKNQIMNSCWRKSKAAWRIVSDIDELLQIDESDLEDITEDIIQFKAFQIVKNTKYRIKIELYDKCLMFKDTVGSMRWSTGLHACNPLMKTKNAVYSKLKYELWHYGRKSRENEDLCKQNFLI